MEYKDIKQGYIYIIYLRSKISTSGQQISLATIVPRNRNILFWHINDSMYKYNPCQKDKIMSANAKCFDDLKNVFL